MYHDDKTVITGQAVIIWDGITQPETTPQGKVAHNIKVALRPGAPEIGELTAIATKALQEDAVFKGQLPPGGNWPLKVAGAGEIDPSVDGHTLINAKTYNGAPQVFDVNGRLLTPIEYGSMLYPGAVVRIIAHAYSFNNVSKGVAFGLDGIQIIDATTPRLAISGGVDAAAAFGAAPVAGAPVGQPPVATPPAAPGAPVATPPAAPGAPVATPPAMPAPAHDFVNPPAAPAGPVMTAKANGVPYETFIAQNWTDELLRQHGYIV